MFSRKIIFKESLSVTCVCKRNQDVKEGREEEGIASLLCRAYCQRKAEVNTHFWDHLLVEMESCLICVADFFIFAFSKVKRLLIAFLRGLERS